MRYSRCENSSCDEDGQKCVNKLYQGYRELLHFTSENEVMVDSNHHSK